MDPIAIGVIVLIRGVYQLWKESQEKQQNISNSYNSQKPVIIKKQIVFVGKTNSGKSTTANALCGAQFQVGPTHGVTQTVESFRYEDFGYNVVDTPGILDTTDYAPQIHGIVAESEIVVFVTTGQMYQQEYDFFKRLSSTRNKDVQTLITFINKNDIKRTTQTMHEIMAERQLIREQAQGYCDEIVFGAAAPMYDGQRQKADIDALSRSIRLRLK